MNYAEIKTCDVANGPGVRVSLFVSGCTHKCKGCFNEIAWPFSYGMPFTQDVINGILKALEPSYIRGLTLLGGEPFEPQNQPECLNLVRQVKAMFPEKNIWAFSGYTPDQMAEKKLGPWEITRELLGYLDVLVDGEFVLEKKNLSLKFRGSSNQRLIDMKKTFEQKKIVLWDE